MKTFTSAFITQLFVLTFMAFNVVFGQISITSLQQVTPEDMVEKFVGEGILYSNVTFTGADVSSGIFSNGESTNLGINAGIFLTSGAGYIIPGPNEDCAASVNNGTPGNATLNGITTSMTYDAAVLEFDFIPMDDTIMLKYVFGSEEYNSTFPFTDVFGFFVSGPNPQGGFYADKNLAKIPGTNINVNSATVNNGPAPCGTPTNGPCNYCQYFVDNYDGTTIEYDGFTTVLTDTLAVIPFEQYHIKIGIADCADPIYDSGILLEEGSFTCPINKITFDERLTPPGLTDEMVEGYVGADVIFRVSNVDYTPLTAHFQIGGTAVNGLDYSNGTGDQIPDSVYFPAGADSAVIHIQPLLDGYTEGPETIILVIENLIGAFVEYDTLTLTIQDYIDMIDQISPNTILCSGQEIKLWVNVYFGFPPYSYDWEPGGFTSDSIILAPDTTTTYVVTYSDLFGETGQDSVKVTVFPVCELETFYFEASLNPGLPYDVYGEVTDDTVFVVFPPGTNLIALIPSFTFENETCPYTVGSVTDFTSPVVFQYSGLGGCSTQWVVVASIGTGMSSYRTEGVVVIPNPSDGKFYLQGIQSPAEITITDLTGNVVYLKTISTEKTIIDLTGKPKGIYFLNVKLNNRTLNQKIILL